MSWDPYLDLAAGVLRNRLGITDADELTRVEADFTSVRITQLLRHPLPGPYDLPHLQAFHRRIFGDAYDWAGELRTVSLGKGRLFCLPQHIVTFADDVFAKLACADHLRGRERPDFVDALSLLLTTGSRASPGTPRPAGSGGFDLAVVDVRSVRRRRAGSGSGGSNGSDAGDTSNGEPGRMTRRL